MFNTGQKRRLPRHAVLSDDAVARSARTTQLGAYNLIPTELFWQVRQPYIDQHGYQLRPRYHPEWKPSWTGTNLSPAFCEDSIILSTAEVIDARRHRDNSLVAIKSLPKGTEEIRIAQFLETLRGDPRNHCVPVYDVFDDPFDPDFAFLVMPFLRQCNDPPFALVGEVIDFMDQVIEGLAFMHEHGVAHRDIAVPNIMMDATPLYPEGYHPVRQNYTADALYRNSPRSRIDRCVQYYIIDFGLSVQFPPGAPHYVVGDVGRDTEVPELSETVPYDPFKVDVMSLGNMFYREFYERYNSMDFMNMENLLDLMRQPQPKARPTMAEVYASWKRIKMTFHPSLYRWRLGPKSEPAIERMFNNTVAAAWNGLYSLSKFVY